MVNVAATPLYTAIINTTNDANLFIIVLGIDSISTTPFVKKYFLDFFLFFLSKFHKHFCVDAVDWNENDLIPYFSFNVNSLNLLVFFLFSSITKSSDIP